MQDRNITHTPDGRWLSNGRYFAFISASGTGQSRLHSYVANRWHGDPVEDAHGQFIYLRDKATGRTWSAAMQPTKHLGERYHAFGSLGTYSIHHVREGIASELEIAVSPTADAEARRLCLHNRSNQTRVIEITSYLEVALNYQGADTGHPAFSKLFVQTTGARELSAVFAERRPRAHDETWPCMFHAMVGAQALEFETDRLRFLGRRRTAFNPAVFDAFDALSGTSGNVLDPCFALRTVVELTAGESTSLTLLTGFGTDRAAALDLVTQLQAPGAVDAIFIEAHNAEITLQSKLSITELEATTFQQHACAVCYGTRSIPRTLHGSLLSPREETVFAALGIPRDRPIIVVKGGWLDQGAIVARKLRDYWASKGLFTNLILLTDNEEAHPAGVDDRVFTVHSSHVDEAGMTMLLLGASLVVDGALPPVKTHSAPQPPPCLQECAIEQSMERKTTALSYYNGYGAFDNEAKEYVIYIKRLGASYRRPPMPWINVIANEGAGFLVSDSGASCTWFRNSQANRMTPWSNDPVSDPYGEALYLRDEDTGLVWSPTPGPVAGGDCEVRHGLGYTTFISDYSKLKAIVTMFVDRHDPVKIVWLRLTNEDARSRRVSLTAYQRLVLGSLAESPSLIATERCGDGSLRARNLAGGSFCDGEFFASLAVHGIPTDSASFTCDRLSFLGRYGTAKSPLSLVLGSKLDETAGVGLDPCFAQQVSFEIPSGATVHCVLVMGEGISKVAANTLVSRYAALDVVSSSLEAARDYWRYLVGGIHLETPSAMMNAMVNTWLPYQTLSCRIWGRTAFYQSSGAYGYRDQLQDAAALLPLDPVYAKQQLLLHARHQFREGDVLHWWHEEPIDRGLRTKFADDLLWLPLVMTDYLEATGDTAFLDERAEYLVAEVLQTGQDEAYLHPERSAESGSLYEHCCRAIDRSLTTGAHGLPLMGTGDWNDGMNRVGRLGKGESVWMGFFLYHILGRFIPYCDARCDGDRVQRYSAHRAHLLAALNNAGWDGAWYRRAYYDNGEVLGSRSNDECSIDALAQAWAVISHAAPPDRANQAVTAMMRELVSEEQGLIRLLTPPFVNTTNDPGYIKGYVAGVRENGGQYTHAACWVVRALAEHGLNNHAARLWEMLTPIAHSLNEAAADRYMVEPYAVAADIYGAPPHVGRGGWTWYTGSSGWMYRVALESILGMKVMGGDSLWLRPCIPDDWPSYRMSYRCPDGSGLYHVQVNNPKRQAARVTEATLDGRPVPVIDGTAQVPLQKDGGVHEVRVVLG